MEMSTNIVALLKEELSIQNENNYCTSSKASLFNFILREIWHDTQGSFVKITNINRVNFSTWLKGKKERPVFVKVVNIFFKQTLFLL